MRGGPGETRAKKNLTGKGRWDVAIGGHTPTNLPGLGCSAREGGIDALHSHAPRPRRVLAALPGTPSGWPAPAPATRS